MTIKLDFRTKLFMTIVLSYVMVLGNIQVKYFLQAIIISVIPIVLFNKYKTYKSSYYWDGYSCVRLWC